MRPRDQKAVLTKAVGSMLKTLTGIKCLQGQTQNPPVTYKVLITPGSPMLVGYFITEHAWYNDRMTISRFSDYMVRNNQFEVIMAALKPTSEVSNEHHLVS